MELGGSQQIQPAPRKFPIFIVGLLEILFVIFLLCILLMTLHFFHVIDLSRFFSTPHIQQPQLSTSSHAPKDSLTISLDTFVSETINPLFSPSCMDGKIKKLPNTIHQQIGEIWNCYQVNITAKLSYDTPTSPTREKITLAISSDPTQKITPQNAKKLFEMYFQQTLIKAMTSTITCSDTTSTASTTCYNTQSTTQGIRVWSVQQIQKLRMFVSSCFIPHASPFISNPVASCDLL